MVNPAIATVIIGVMIVIVSVIVIALLIKIADRLADLYFILNDGFTMVGDLIALYKSSMDKEKHDDGT